MFLVSSIKGNSAMNHDELGIKYLSILRKKEVILFLLFNPLNKLQKSKQFILCFPILTNTFPAVVSSRPGLGRV